MKKKTGKMTEKEEEYHECDFCKKPMGNNSLLKEGELPLEQSGKISFVFGYYSRRDGEELILDVCSECATDIEKMLRDKYQNLPAVKEYI